jgi:hypothetical protein
MTMTFHPRAALPATRDQDLCKSACTFASIHGGCTTKCQVSDIVEQHSTPPKARAKSTSKPSIDAAAIYRAINTPRTPTTHAATAPPRRPRTLGEIASEIYR